MHGVQNIPLDACILSAKNAYAPVHTLLSRQNQSPDAVRSRNLSKSTLAHDAVAAAVSYKHYVIICVGTGLIQFVYGSHSKRGHGAYPIKNSIFAIFRASLIQSLMIRLLDPSRPKFTSLTSPWLLLAAASSTPRG